MSDNSTPTAARLWLAPFEYGPAARPVACEALSAGIPLPNPPLGKQISRYYPGPFPDVTAPVGLSGSSEVCRFRLLIPRCRFVLPVQRARDGVPA